MKTSSVAVASLALLLAGPCLATSAIPLFSQTLTLSGSISPTTADIQFQELVYYMTDGVSYVSGAAPLAGSCAAGTTCPFSDTVGILGGLANPAISVAYSILGFYTGAGNSTPGPQFLPESPANVFGDFTDCPPDNSPGCTVNPGFYVVFQNPDVFAVTGSAWGGGTFDQFFDPSQTTGHGLGFVTLEDQVSTTFFDGRYLVADGIPANAYLNMATIPLGGTLAGGNITDFSNGTPNGTVSLSAEVSSAPEPSSTMILAGLLAVLAAWRARRPVADR